MGIISEFKEFAIKGNAVELAIGLIIATEFGKIVNSLVADVIMPPIGYIVGNVDFKNLFFILKPGLLQPGPYPTLVDAQKAGAITINIGLFLTTVISFLIVGFVVFLIARSVNKLKGPQPEAAKI